MNIRLIGKFSPYEGGTKTAAFISGPTILNRSGAVSNEYLSFCYLPKPIILSLKGWNSFFTQKS